MTGCASTGHEEESSFRIMGKLNQDLPGTGGQKTYVGEEFPIQNNYGCRKAGEVTS